MGGSFFVAAETKVRAPKGWDVGSGVPSPRGEIFFGIFTLKMVRFSADLITGTGLVAHYREHYLWLSLENWTKLSAESISIKILLT